MTNVRIRSFDFEFDTSDWSDGLEDLRVRALSLVDGWLSEQSDERLKEVEVSWSALDEYGDPRHWNHRLEGAAGELQEAIDQAWVEAMKGVDTRHLTGHSFRLVSVSS